MGLPNFPEPPNVPLDQVGETVDKFEHDVNPDEIPEHENEDEKHSEEPESSVTEVVSTTEDEAKPTTAAVEVITEPTPIPFAIISKLKYEDAVVQRPEKRYPYTIILARTDEDISWIDTATGHDPMLTKAIYNVHNPSFPYKVPSNKGHEVMVYLTYIIDFYDVLPPVNIFMHAHQYAWHNNPFLDGSNAETLKHLNHNKVMREGYMNLRCHIDADCPGHLFPIAKNSSRDIIPEEHIFGEAWSQILPLEPVPEVVSQPCCGQFAVSRDRIRILPKSQYEFFRDWLLQTHLADRLSGRVWEYVYQYIWAGVPEFCPSASVCYCDGFGLCFGGEEEYEAVKAKLTELNQLRHRMKDGNPKGPAGNHGEHRDLKKEIEEAEEWIKERKERAWERGRDREARARDTGRPVEQRADWGAGMEEGEKEGEGDRAEPEGKGEGEGGEKQEKISIEVKSVVENNWEEIPHR